MKSLTPGLVIHVKLLPLMEKGFGTTTKSTCFSLQFCDKQLSLFLPCLLFPFICDTPHSVSLSISPHPNIPSLPQANSLLSMRKTNWLHLLLAQTSRRVEVFPSPPKMRRSNCLSEQPLGLVRRTRQDWRLS